MERVKTEHTQGEFWENLRETFRSGLHEVRVKGDEYARQARLRVEIFQAERRLNRAYQTLGEAVAEGLDHEHDVSYTDPDVKDAYDHVRYCRDELKRLQEELKRTPEVEVTE